MLPQCEVDTGGQHEYGFCALIKLKSGIAAKGKRQPQMPLDPTEDPSGSLAARDAQHGGGRLMSQECEVRLNGSSNS